MNQSPCSGFSAELQSSNQHAAGSQHEGLQHDKDQKPGDYGSQQQSPEQKAEEAHRIQRMQRMIALVEQVIAQDQSLPVERASALVADARRAALAMFPDKARAFDMLVWPRLQRTMRERYRMQ